MCEEKTEYEELELIPPEPEYDTGAGLTTSSSQSLYQGDACYDYYKMMWWALALFAFEIFLVKTMGVQLQRASRELTIYYQEVLDSEYFEEFSDFLHHSVSSHVWLLLCSLVYWSVDSFEGAHLYLVACFGFAFKSLAKNLIRSPRVFWVASEMHCFYCGKGFSLPSGHSMMSCLVLLFLSHKIREPWMIAFSILFELIIFVNVVYIGTHSFSDVFVGWTAAIVVVLAFVLVEWKMQRFFRVRKEPAVETQVVFFGYLIAFIAILDVADTVFSSPNFPLMWQYNMARACHMDPDDTAALMYLRLQMSNIPIAVGASIGQLLRRHFLVTKKFGHMDGLTAIERIGLGMVGGVIFMRMSKIVKLGMVFIGHPEYFYHVYNFIQPILVLYVIPWCCLVLYRKVLGWAGVPTAEKKRRFKKKMSVL